MKDTGSVVTQDNKGRVGRFVFRRVVTNVLDTQPTIEESKKIIHKSKENNENSSVECKVINWSW